jgi:hypothetical protein
MKKILLLIAFLYFPFLVFTQNYSFDWVKAFNSNNSSYYILDNAIITDNESNVYYTTNFIGSIDLDPSDKFDYFFSNDFETYNSYLVKLDKDGNYKFGVQLNDNFSFVKSIYVDKYKQIYVCGGYNSIKNWNLFINKYDQDGNLIWKKSITNIHATDAYSLVVDDKGYIYFTGYFENENYVGSKTYHKDLIIKKLDSNGNQIWSVSIGGNNDVIGNNIKLDNEGNVLVGGSFIGEVDFDPKSGKYMLTTDSLVRNGYVLKLDPFGSFVWAKKIGSDEHSNVSKIEIDKSNNVFISGFYRKNANIDKSIVFKSTNINSNTYITYLSSDGTYKWNTSFSGIEHIDICLDNNDNLFCSTTQNSNIYLESKSGIIKTYSPSYLILKFNKNLDIEWGKSLAIKYSGSCYTHINCDIENKLLISGTFIETVDFDINSGIYNLSSIYNKNTQFYNLSDFILKLKPNTLAIEDQIADNQDLKIFPNPTNNAIQIPANPFINNKNFTITDILGKTVKSGKINNPDDKIDLSDFNSGAYYLKIEDYLNAFKIIKID